MARNTSKEHAANHLLESIYNKIDRGVGIWIQYQSRDRLVIALHATIDESAVSLGVGVSPDGSPSLVLGRNTWKLDPVWFEYGKGITFAALATAVLSRSQADPRFAKAASLKVPSELIDYAQFLLAEFEIREDHSLFRG